MMQKLNGKQDSNPFKIPEKYFEEVNRKIISATSGYNQDVGKVALYRRFRPYILIAASVTGFIILSYSAVKLFTPDKINSLLSEVLYEEYSEMFTIDFDILSLEENAASLILSVEVPKVNKTDIIDYLLLENIELNEIYEQP